VVWVCVVSGPGNTGPGPTTHIGINIGIIFHSSAGVQRTRTFSFLIACYRGSAYGLPPLALLARYRAGRHGVRYAPPCPRRAGSRPMSYLYLLSTLALLAPLFVPPWPTVSRVRSSLAPLYCILTGTYRERQFLSVNRPVDPSVPTSF